MSENKLFNNPLRIGKRDVVILDSDHPNWCKVEVISLSDNHMFANIQIVAEDTEPYDVMTSRLSKEKL